MTATNITSMQNQPPHDYDDNFRANQNISFTSIGHKGQGKFVSIEDEYFITNKKNDPANQTGNFNSRQSNMLTKKSSPQFEDTSSHDRETLNRRPL